MEKLYYDIDTSKIVTEREIRAYFEQCQREMPEDYEGMDFDEFIAECHPNSGGSLIDYDKRNDI